MKLVLSSLIILFALSTNAQTPVIIEGKSYTNNNDVWLGVNIQRSVRTALTFKNNSITSINRTGYMLQAGDERESSTNNNLDKAIITGNTFKWNGTDMTSIAHGLFTGHNSDVLVKNNYLDGVPMGIIRKSTTNMSNTGGGVAYNIVKGGAVAIVVKGMSNVNIYNNTLYSSRTTSQSWRPLVHIYTNNDAEPKSLSHGTKIFNNIFYTKYQTFAISVDDTESLTGLKCDYNVYWCESGSPRFSVAGSAKTFAQWQAMGFDAHSVVINPNFKDLINFVPATRLDFGTDLGAEWQAGLSVNAKWGVSDPDTTIQNGKWQVGAVLYGATTTDVPAPAPVPAYVSSVININTPSVLEATFSLDLANIVPGVAAFSVVVNSGARTVNSVTVAGTKVNLTIASPVLYGDVVTFAYSKPDTNALVTASGGQTESISPTTVQNNISENITITEQPVYISSIIENTTPSMVEVTYNQILANIIPVATAFKAEVNGYIKTVMSVSITDNKVTLTLPEPLSYGDIITVSYTAPDGNPLQNAAGITAESIDALTVINNIQRSFADSGNGNSEEIYIYPNPAGNYITIANLKPSLQERIVRIFNYSGKIFMEIRLDARNLKRLPLNLESGMYFIQILTGPIVEFVETLIVVE